MFYQRLIRRFIIIFTNMDIDEFRKQQLEPVGRQLPPGYTGHVPVVRTHTFGRTYGTSVDAAVCSPGQSLVWVWLIGLSHLTTSLIPGRADCRNQCGHQSEKAVFPAQGNRQSHWY